MKVDTSTMTECISLSVERHQTDGSRCLPGIWNMVTTGLTELEDYSETMKIVAIASLGIGPI
jgi:hypothetical protein